MIARNAVQRGATPDLEANDMDNCFITERFGCLRHRANAPLTSQRQGCNRVVMLKAG